MRDIERITAAALLGAAMLHPALAAEGSIREVTLSSGGLAEVVREVPVGADGTVRIEVPLDQVDDVLKSLVVIGGAATVRSLSLGGLSPVEEVMRRMPFSADDMAALPSLIGRLQGVRVEAEGAGRKASGTVLGVGVERGENGTETPILSLMDDDGGALAVPLGTGVRIRILDEEVRAKIAEASAAIGRAKADGSRVVSLRLDGPEGASADIAYVVAAPLWKTAYRVVVDAPKQTARLQAWAILENATGEDWTGVGLTLSSGTPVTLKQRLFERYWRERPEVPVDVDGVAAPRPDGGAMPTPMPMQSMNPSADNAMYEQSFAAMAPPPPMPSSRSYAEAVPVRQAAASEGDVSASFVVPGPVDLAAGDTLSVPILDRAVKAERLSLFQEGSGSPHPVAALMLANETPTSLPPGILTVFDGEDGYLGDAQLLAMPAGETRMVSFALDRKVRIASDVDPQRTVVRVKAVDGILNFDVRSRDRTLYRIEGADDAARTVIIEHPIRPGWVFSSGAEVATSATAHRLRVEVDKGGSASVEAVDERIDAQTLSLADANPDVILSWASEIADPAAKATLAELAGARRAMAEVERAIYDLDERRRRIVEEQERIRANLAAIPQQSSLAEDYLGDLARQEGDLDDLASRRAELERQWSTHRDAVGAAIARL